MAQPEYKLSAPNTGSYQLAPQASPVSVYTRPKQADPNLTDYKAQVDSFQNFVKSMADWRIAENKDNQEKAKLRALADDARGELDDSLEAEDEDYQKYGRFLQGKNYAKDVGSKLVTEITVGFEGKKGLMDQAFAEAKLPENADRKVEDIFSELLEDRKDHYRDQVPDSSDEFYSGFGEAMQPFANEINKAFYEKVQKETYSDRRENFSQGLRDRIEVQVLSYQRATDKEKKKIVFNQDSLRAYAADNGAASGLSDDAAIGEAIRIWGDEVGEIILNADSEEDLEVAEKMLDVFDTASKGRARLIDIPVFSKEAGQVYVSLGKVIQERKIKIEAKDKKELDDKRLEQERDLFDNYVNKGDWPSPEELKTRFPLIKASELRASKTFQEKAKENLGKIDTDSQKYRDAYVDLEFKARTGALSEDGLREISSTLIQKDFTRLLGYIRSNTTLDKNVLKYIEEQIRLTELAELSPGLKSEMAGLSVFELQNPEGHRKWSLSLKTLGIRAAIEAEKILKTNTEELTTERQLEIMQEAVKKIQPDIDKHNKLVAGWNQRQVADTASKNPPEEIKPLTIEISENSSIDVSGEKQTRYFKNTNGKKSGLDLYNDYFDFTLSIRGAGMALDKEDNIFASLEGSNEEKRKAGKALFLELQRRLPEKNWPVGEDNKGMKWVQWVRGSIKDEIEHMKPLDKGLKDALLALHQDVFPGKTPLEIPEQEPSALDKLQKFHSKQ